MIVAGIMVAVVAQRALAAVQERFPDLDLNYEQVIPDYAAGVPRSHPMIRGTFRLTIDGVPWGHGLNFELAAAMATNGDEEEEMEEIVGQMMRTVRSYRAHSSSRGGKPSGQRGGAR